MLGLSLRRQSRILPQIILKAGCYSSPADHERWTQLDDTEKERLQKMRKLKKWRAPESREEHYLQAFNVSDNRHGIFEQRKLKLTDFVAWYKSQEVEYLRWSQRYIPERHEILGNDLALAHFLVHRNGKIRRKGSTNYITQEDESSLPNSFDPTWFLEEIDASGTEICYEGLDNFVGLSRLRKASFRNCLNFDDFCLDRVVAVCPNLEVLDISENPNITERGLEGMYRAWNLQTLIVTDWGHGLAFELTCLLLEECNPHLNVVMKKASPDNAELQGDPNMIAETSVKHESQVVK